MSTSTPNVAIVADALAEMSSDQAGADTFRRYKWQAKQAVWKWLACLGPEEDAPVAIVCEHVEDLVIVYSNRVVFAQLKTKTKGSWSDSSVCDKGHGLDSLVRAFATASKTAVAKVSSYELWLEGSAAATVSTTQFFGDPKLASPSIRLRIGKLGLGSDVMDVFLSRLQIRPQQPSQAHIDAVILQYVGALWPAMTSPERDVIYLTLLGYAEKAQAHELDSVVVAGHVSDEIFPHDETDENPAGLALLAQHSLTRELIVSLTPPIEGTSRVELLRRLQEGGAVSALELKMRAAGAKDETILRAQALRAGAEVQRLRLVASRDNAEEALEKLEKKLLGFANAHTASTRLASAGNPAIAAMPAEHVFSEIRKEPGNLLSLDGQDLFARDPDDIFGFLCQLSDACKFWWRDE